MARANWLTDEHTPDLDAHVSQLEHFAAALADGVVDASELATQEQNLVTAMRAVESSLSDEQHAKVTKLLAELTAYNVMQVLHDMAAARVEQAMARKK
jgi:mannose/fructose-specific phosphotransferase system component IIA